MSKLPQAKRNHLILIGIITLVIIAGLWTLVVSDQRETITKLEAQTAKIREKMNKADREFKFREDVENRLNERLQTLKDKEAQMAPDDDPYNWMLGKIIQFKENRQVDFFLNRPEFPKPIGVLPTFTYKTAVFKFTGSGSYSAIGRFVADFENEFRLFQIRNMSIKPVSIRGARSGAVITGEDQTLQVEFEIVALLRGPSVATAK